MTNALPDENNRPSAIAVDQTDPTVINRITANPSNFNSLMVDDNTTGSDNGNNGGDALLDDQGVPVWSALSSDGSGELVEIYSTSDGKVLIDSN